MPQLNVTGRPLTELEKFVASELPGVPDQEATLEKLRTLFLRAAHGTNPEDEKLKNELTALLEAAEPEEDLL